MLPDTLVFGRIKIKLDAIGSTNDYIHDLLTKGEDLTEGTVVFAENQSAGRGQRGNKWDSEPGQNLTFSVVLFPKFLSPSDQFSLSKAISLGIVSYLSEVLSVNMSAIRVKWPNDIYVKDKKIGGILIENAVSGTKLIHSIIGIGINVNQEEFNPGLPNPSSMKLVAGCGFELNEVLSELCTHLDRRYFELRNCSHQNMHTEYLDKLYEYQVWRDFKVKGVAIRGRILDVMRSGKLVIEVKDGEDIQCDYKEVVFC